MSSVNVIIPIPGDRGVAVCDLADLLASVVTGEVKLDDVAFDTTFSDTEAIDLIPAVRDLNATNDVAAYWAARGSPMMPTKDAPPD